MNIYEKMAEVMKAVKYLSKDGNISYKTTQYKAITEEKVTSIVREKVDRERPGDFPYQAGSYKRWIANYGRCYIQDGKYRKAR